MKEKTYSITDVAKEVGLDPLECPHCAKEVKTTGLLRAMFTRALRRLNQGDRLHIRGFGGFRVKKHPPRKFRTPLFPDMTELPPFCQILFKQAPRAKALLNKRRTRSWKKYHKAEPT